MEMWFLGFYIDEFRLALFTAFTVPMLVGLSYYDGFETTSRVYEDIVDAFVACAVGFVVSASILLAFGTITREMAADEIIGKITIQAAICSFGAMFAQSLLNDRSDETEEKKREASYFGELFLMAVGALFLSMSVAPTEEMNLISYQMSDWHAVVLAAVTLMLMHAFVYAVKIRGKEKAISAAEPFIKVFLRFTVVGYAIALLISFYILWTFGSLDDLGWAEQLKVVIVLGFPAAVGAAASRLIL